MNYKKKVLKNGLRVLFVDMPSLPSATVTVWAKTGSRFESKRVNGISHFLEHMVFKGSKARPSALAISTSVDAIGGEFNAATSKDWTNYYIKARAGNAETAFDVISDMVLNPLLKEEEIEREKGVIIEEIAMYEDTPMIKVGDVFEGLIFDGNPLSWDIAGSPKTVRSTKKDDFIRYRKSHYYAQNMLLTVAGGVKEEKVYNLAENYFGGLETGQNVKEKFDEFGEVQKSPKLKLRSKKQEQAHFILGFLGHGRDYKEKFAEALLATILGGGMSSRLFIEVRERRGLAYAVRTNIERFSETGYLGTYAGVDPKKIKDAIKVILEQTYGLKDGKYPISKDELNKAKEYLKGHLALALEDTKDVNSFFAEQELFLEKILTPEEVFKKLDLVTIDDLLKEAKILFVPEKLNLAIIGPYEDSKRFEKLLG